MTARKRIKREECVKIGFTKKSHGVEGKLLAMIDKGYEDTIEAVDYLFLEIEGLLVPYFIEALEWRGDDSVALQLAFIQSKEEARKFSALSIFVHQGDVQVQDDDYGVHQLKGYIIIDRQLGEIGVIAAIDDYGGNLVMTVNYQGKELLLPFNEALVVAVQPENSTLIMNFPEGLLNLNS